MQLKRALLATAAIAATVVASVCGVGLSMGMVRDHASDGAGELAPVIVPTPRPIDTSTLALHAPAGSNQGSTTDHRSNEEHEHGKDADD